MLTDRLCVEDWGGFEVIDVDPGCWARIWIVSEGVVCAMRLICGYRNVAGGNVHDLLDSVGGTLPQSLEYASENVGQCIASEIRMSVT